MFQKLKYGLSRKSEQPKQEQIPIRVKDTTFESETWKVLCLIVCLGLFLIIVVSSIAISKEQTNATNVKHYLTAMSAGLLIAGSCFCIGTLMGFLFGIPRVSKVPDVPGEEGAKNTIMQNDNLVEISDWITKIIVGVGLTQMYRVPEQLMSLGQYLAPSFCHAKGSELAANISIIIVLYFVVTGFLCAYLWTRLYFSEMLNNRIKRLSNKLKEKEDTLEAQQDELNSQGIELKKKEIEVQAFKSSFADPINDLKSKIVEGSRNSDPNLGNFGGSPENNGRKVTATVVQSSFDAELFVIDAEVTGTDEGNPLSGAVYFHLHPTFIQPIRKVDVKDGVARLKLIAYGAFTLGVECDGGNTRLELDLSVLPDAPQLFKER